MSGREARGKGYGREKKPGRERAYSRRTSSCLALLL